MSFSFWNCKRNIALINLCLCLLFQILLWLEFQSSSPICLLCCYVCKSRVEEEYGILTKSGMMFLLRQFHFQFKSANISTILTSKLTICLYVWRLVSWLLLGIYISWVESSVHKQISLNCVFFLRREKWYICLRNCCDLTFRAESGLNSILEHLHIIEVLMHANATIMFKDYRCSL